MCFPQIEIEIEKGVLRKTNEKEETKKKRKDDGLKRERERERERERVSTKEWRSNRSKTNKRNEHAAFFAAYLY